MVQSTKREIELKSTAENWNTKGKAFLMIECNKTISKLNSSFIYFLSIDCNLVALHIYSSNVEWRAPFLCILSWLAVAIFQKLANCSVKPLWSIQLLLSKISTTMTSATRMIMITVHAFPWKQILSNAVFLWRLSGDNYKQQVFMIIRHVVRWLVC